MPAVVEVLREGGFSSVAFEQRINVVASNNVTIEGSDNAPMIFGGTVNGNVSGATVGAADQTAPGAELRDLIAELRELVRTLQIAKQEVIEDNLEELAEAAEDPGSANPAVPVSRGEKVKKLLGGVAEFAGLTVKISEQVTKLWPS
ncbi:hypothetical protein QRX50_13790 [Amycolatopsis carbonis]|uniref:Uncharacterized protein n=1 Tax=Amycolatopsis carbonis TaxID=715471 RepID=A0A9Y2N095_9PSEU|nr:hypothetical protein [Amycolatopsis sp. 2-15]WIX81747.1 hypothetical protein QRX50_13790 [Amycolatopsis sp. 2-15]